MNYDELERLKKTREYEAASQMEDAVNSFSWDEKKFAQAFSTWHRTLQQTFFRTVVEVIKTAASDNYGFDPRNMATHELARRIVESGALDESYLPMV